jgi:hypothetical protein
MENHQKQLRSLLTLNFQTFDHSRIYAPWSINTVYAFWKGPEYPVQTWFPGRTKGAVEYPPA